jgi:hypothetical protein
MPDTFFVGRVIEKPPLEWLPDTFILRWHSDENQDPALEIWEPGISPTDEAVVSASLPATVAKTANDPEWNRPSGSGDERWSHHIMVGSSNLVDPHSIVINTRYDDTGDPFLAVWDWINGIVYGPLVLTEFQQQLEGPIAIGDFLYFFGVDAATLKVGLHRTLHNLRQPSNPGVTGADPVGTESVASIHATGSLNHAMIQGNFISVLESPVAGQNNPFTTAHVWNFASPGTPFSPATVVMPGNYFYSPMKMNEPDRRNLVSADSFMIISNQPTSVDTVTAVNVTATTLFNTGSWGIFFFGSTNFERSFTIENDGTTVFYSFNDSVGFNNKTSGRRTWDTGVLLEPDEIFDTPALLPAGWRSMRFPFE